MLNKVGIKTFYGQAFLPDICELSNDMLTYTKKYFEELIKTGKNKRNYVQVSFGIRKEKISVRILSELIWKNIKIPDLNYFAVSRYLKVRFWAVVSIQSMIYLIIQDLKIRYLFVKNMIIPKS